MNNTGGAALCKWGGSGARAKLRTMVDEKTLNGSLNPDWVEWLMGWPIGWTQVAPLAELRWEPVDVEPLDVPRVAVGVANRAARLKCIGNGQVPRALVLAVRVLIADNPLARGALGGNERRNEG